MTATPRMSASRSAILHLHRDADTGRAAEYEWPFGSEPGEDPHPFPGYPDEAQFRCFPEELGAPRAGEDAEEGSDGEASAGEADEQQAEEGCVLRVAPVLGEFSARADSESWPQCTTTCCFWCCHSFEGVPLGLPHRMAGGQYQTVGCFCSAPCAVAFNEASCESNAVKFRRHTLLCELVGSDGRRLPQAPPRESLKMFGGSMGVEEFRGASARSLFLMSAPPMRALACSVEEVADTSITDGFCAQPQAAPDAPAPAERAQGLRRPKPLLDSRFTLDGSMGLKIVP
jgi:hypothetical protein